MATADARLCSRYHRGVLRFASVVSLVFAGACVTDPVIADLAPSDLASDLASAGADLVASDLTGVTDLATSGDLATPADLASADLAPLLPTWGERNDGLLGGELFGVAATPTSIYVASLYDVFRSGAALDGFVRVVRPNDRFDGGINAIASYGETLYVALPNGRVLMLSAGTFEDITTDTYPGDKPMKNRSVNLITARQRVAVSDGLSVFEFEATRMPPWRNVSLVTNAPTANINALRYSEDGLRLLVAADNGLSAFESDAWTAQSVTGATPPFVWVDTFGAATTYREAVMTGNVPFYRSSGWGGLPNTTAPNPVHLLIGANDHLVLDAADGLYSLADLDATAWTHDYDLPNAGFNQIVWSNDRTKLFGAGPRGLYVAPSDMLGAGTHYVTRITAVTPTALAPSSLDATRIFAATESGLFVSQDDGAHWAPTGTPYFSVGAMPSRVTTSRLSTGTLESVFVIAGNKLLRSLDSGNVFAELEGAHAVTTWNDATHAGWVAYCPGAFGNSSGPKLSQNFGSDAVDLTGPARCDEILALSSGAIVVTAGREIWRATAPSATSQAMTLTGLLPAGFTAASLREIYGSGGVLALTNTGTSAKDLYVLPVSGAAIAVPRPSVDASLQAIATSPTDPATFWVAVAGDVLVGDFSSGMYRPVALGLSGPYVTTLLRRASAATAGFAGVSARGIYATQ